MQLSITVCKYICSPSHVNLLISSEATATLFYPILVRCKTLLFTQLSIGIVENQSRVFVVKQEVEVLEDQVPDIPGQLLRACQTGRGIG